MIFLNYFTKFAEGSDALVTDIQYNDASLNPLMIKLPSIVTFPVTVLPATSTPSRSPNELSILASVSKLSDKCFFKKVLYFIYH